MADRAQRRAAQLAYALGDHVDHRVQFGRLLVEHQVIVAEVRARHVPVEILGLPVESGHVGQEYVQPARQVPRGIGAEIRRGGESCGLARLDVLGHGLTPEGN